MNNDLLTQHRSAKLYTDTPVSNDQLKALWDVAKWAPSESNSCPMRLTFISSPAQKARLLPHVAEGNRVKVESAPVTAIVAYDSQFTEKLGKLAPHLKAPTYFDTMPEAAREWAGMRSANLQAGMLIAAARNMGLDCGPLGGFDRPGVDSEFYSDSSWRTSFLMMLGVADADEYYPRGSRLDFEEACEIL